MSDIFDELDNPTVRTSASEYFGQVKLDAWDCVLVKGTGKVPFNPQQHKEDEKRTSIDINIFPLPEMNISYDVSRNMIAQSREWAGIVLPSVKNLGISARDLNGKWAQVRTKSTGSTYVGRDGQTKDRTTFEFVAVFPDEQSCRAAYQGAGAAPAPVTPPPAPASNGTDPGKAVALKFLPTIIQNACAGQTDLNVIRSTVATNLAAMPQIGKYFTVDSPEVMNLIMAGMVR